MSASADPTAKQATITASLIMREKLSWRTKLVAQAYQTQKMPEASGHSRLILLNWVSYCLAAQSVDQAVAATLSLDPHEKKATFNLATNTRVESSSFCFGRAFFSQLQSVFQPGGVSDEVIQSLMDIFAEYAFEQIHRKLQLLDAAGPRTEVGLTRPNILRLVQKWSDERTPERLQAFKSIQLSITHLIGSDFIQDMRDVSAHRTFAHADVSFMLKLHRRLWKLNFYRSGVRALRDSTGARRLQGLMSSGWEFTHAWLPVLKPVSITLCHDPYTVTMSIFDHQSSGHRPTPSDLGECTACDGSLLMNAWRAGDVVTLRLHPEMQIMTALLAQGVHPRSEAGMIGCSKRPCVMCARCLDGGTENGARTFTYTPTCRKVCLDWLAPGLIQDEGAIDLPFQISVAAAAHKVWRRLTVPEHLQ
ncbi:hypothetical protein BDZ89DRAFT_1066224 [Hymenopellis radicata]|nr:hypothetical protein BDZ89DRAFT_1066224 [Hymenopellis radicata]